MRLPLQPGDLPPLSENIDQSVIPGQKEIAQQQQDQEQEKTAELPFPLRLSKKALQLLVTVLGL
jgi:hypothetical protein